MPASTWRDADPRGGHGPPPRSVTSVVTRTRVALAAARWGESALFLVTGLCLTLAALAASGAVLGRLDAWVAAGVGGLLCGLAWGLEHHASAGAVARALDRSLRHQGGLLTAWEIERRAEAGAMRSPMARLVVERARRRLRPGEALRATLPPLALPIAAPLIGAGVLATVLEIRRPADVSTEIDLASLLAGSVTALDAAAARTEDGAESGGVDPGRAGPGRVDPGAVRELAERVRAARSLERRAGLLEPREVLAEIDRLDGELAELAPRLASAPDLRRDLEAARNWLDAARTGLASAVGGAGPPEGAGAPGGEADRALAGGASDATVPRSIPAEARPGDSGESGGSGDAPPPAATPARDTGTTAASWWPAEYDPIVAGWTEWRRRNPALPAPREGGNDRDER